MAAKTEGEESRCGYQQQCDSRWKPRTSRALPHHMLWVGGRCRYLPWKLITIFKFAPFIELTIIGSSRSNNSAQLRGRSGDRCRSTISTRVVDDNRPPYAESVDGPASEGPTACHPTPIITQRCKLHLDKGYIRRIRAHRRRLLLIPCLRRSIRSKI